MLSKLAACALIAPLSGCDAGACTLNIEPGVEIAVRDGVSGEYLTVSPRGVVREGTYEDSLEVSGFTDDVPPRVRTLMGAQERPGRYVVQIAADGYLPWDTAGVRVNEGDCHVQTARFSAELEPGP